MVGSDRNLEEKFKANPIKHWAVAKCYIRVRQSEEDWYLECQKYFYDIFIHCIYLYFDIYVFSPTLGSNFLLTPTMFCLTRFTLLFCLLEDTK